MDIGHIRDRRVAHQPLEILPWRRADLIHCQPPPRVTCAEEGGDVDYTAHGHGSLEAVAMANDPVGHVATVAATSYPESIGVESATRQRGIQPSHDVLIVLAAPVLKDGMHEHSPIACPAPRVAEDNGIAACRQQLELQEKGIPIHKGWAAVNL